MDKIQSIYDLYLSKGIISEDVSLEMFSSVDSEKLNTLHKVGLEAGVISKDVDVDMFSSAWGVKKKDGSESPSEGGSSDFAQISDEDLSITTDLAFQNAGIPKIIGGFLVPAVTRGLVAGSAADETFNVMSGGKEVSDEALDEYIKVNKLSEAMGESDAMKEFNEKYDENVKNGDSGIWAFLKGVAENPKVAAEVAATSMAQMASAGFSSAETMGMMAAGAGAGAAIGAGLGTLGGPLAPATATIGAVGGTIKGAMAAAGGITEVSASFTEFLKDELGEKEFTQENIRQVLADEEAKQRIINKSLARGATVAAIDFLAAGASGKAVSGITKVGRTGKVLRGAAGTGIEAAGGATGETAARLVTGQDLDTKEIMFEAIGEAPGAVVSGPIGLLSAPKYNINKSRLSKNDFLKVIETSTDQDLLDMNITIDNDEAMSDILNKRVEKASLKKDIDPSITDEKDIDSVVDLEIKIKELRKKNTTSAKNRIKEYSNKIKDIQSKYDDVDSETVVEEVDTPLQQPKQKVSEVLNRPVILTALGGSTLDTPIEGDLYVEGQQVVIEDTEGNITEVGNVDEIGESNLTDLGITEQLPSVTPTSEGNLLFNDEVLVTESAQIKRNKKGDVNRVVLRNEDGSVTRTLRGANAEEAAYQILLKEATSPEQAEFINEQLEQNDEFREATKATEATTDQDTQQPAKGNRLRVEPLPDATKISNRITGRTESDQQGPREFAELDEQKSTRIAEAYDKLQDTPNDPKVKRAYNALVNETLQQYKAMSEAGYSIVIDNDEPYSNSSDMINDLRENKKIKIFSTESGFGDTGISDQQRANNPMLQDSGLKDANGNKLLVNDVFRAVHDFFGHAQEGNSFGPKGEEIAWQVHSEMFSEDARRALTTETRGQNSWVNFSGVNKEAFSMRDQARDLRKKAQSETDTAKKIDMLNQAKSMVEKAYESMKFADQKIGLLPDEFVFDDANQDAKTERTKGPTKTVDFNTVKNKALKAISSVVPGVKVVLHSTPASYAKAVGNQNSRGAFLPGDNTIHINTTTANEQTIAHETFHALMLNKLKSDNEVSKRTESLINAVSKTAPAEIKAYLDAFASNYDANMQSEEKIAELVGVLSSGYPQLDAPSKLSIKNFIQYIATKLGLKEFTDREAIDFLNTISKKIGTGETITTEDVAILERRSTLGGKMSKRFQANFKDETSGLEFIYDKNSEAFQTLVDNGFVTKDKSIIDFANNFIFLHQPDAAFSGEIMKDGEVIVEGKGGMYYPIKFHDKGYFWASTANTATKMASDLNKVYVQNNGKILMALTSAPSDKLLSSTTMSNAVLDFFTSKAVDRKFKLKKNDFNKALVKAANTTVVKKTKTGEKLVGLGLKTRVSSDMNKTISLIKEKLGADNSSFGDRKTFAEALIGNVADIIKNDPKATEQFADLFSVGIQNKYFKGISKTGKKSISKANITQAISEMFTEPILKDNIDREKGGQVYAILELDSKVEPVDATEHESYPKAIKAVDGNVKLHILKDRFKWNELFEDPQTNDIVSKDREKKIYPTSGVSTQGLKLNVSNINEKLQKSGVDFDAIKTIKSGLKLGISETTILETLKEQGYDPNNAYELLQNYKEEYRKEQSKKEGLFDDTNNVLLQQLDKAYRTSLSPRGFLPKSMMIAKEVLQGMIDSEVKNARRNIELLDRKLKRYSKENLRVVVDNIDAYIRGNNEVELDADIKEIASEMRNHIDNLSQKLIESGAVDSQESIDNIKNNMGSYLNRSYKLFDRNNYRKSVPESVMNAAKLKLKEIYREQAEEESQQTGVDVNTILNRRVDSVIENILSKNEADAFVASSKTGSKNLKSLSRKKDIPAEIRALMGEYGDPSFNYIQSVNKIQSIVSNQMFLDKMRVKGEGVFFFKEPTGAANVLVAAKGSEEYNPLNGYYTTKEIKDAIDNKNRLQVKLGKYGDPVLNFYMGMLGFVKKSKTVFSIGTQMKNVIGIVPVLIANGYVTDFQSFRTALQALDNDLRNKNNADLNTKMNEYLESGIINSNIVVSEIRSMMKKGETFEDAMIKRLSDDTNPVKDFAIKGYQAIDKALTKAYQTTDDFSKILGYEVEKKRYAKAKYKTEFDNLTEAQKQEVRDVAAEIIKNNIPNYNRVGGAVKALKVIPVAGTFISFHAEAIRTAFNTVNLAVEEMKNPETAEIGKQRLAGILAVSATATLLPLMFGLSSIGDIDEEEDSKAMKYARMFMPDWDKNSSVVISEQPKDGKFSYVSLSASDPYGALSQAVNAFMAGENLAESAGNAIWELVSPFFEEDLVVSSLGDMWTDLVNVGKGVDTFGEGISNFSSNAWKMVQPGTFTSAVRVKNAYIDKEKSTAKEIVGQVTGFKPRQIDIAQQAFFISKEANTLAYEAKKEYNKAKRKLINGEPGVTLQDVKDQYALANKKQQELYGELIKMYKGATYLGASQTKILDQMKEAGISKDIMRGVVYGIIPDMNK